MRKLVVVLDTGKTFLFSRGYQNAVFQKDKWKVTGKGEIDEPACDAINILTKYADKLSAFIVDDFREFGKPGFPKKSHLIDACEDFFGDHTKLTVHLDQVIVLRMNA